MVNDSVNAFVRKDDKLAAEVIATDDQVDRLFEEIKMELMEEIAKNPNSSGSELDVLMIAKYMERTDSIQFSCGFQIVSKGFFNNDTGMATIQMSFFDMQRNYSVQRWRGGQIE